MLLSLGLACIAVLGFGSSAVLARLGMQAMRPMPSALVSMVASTLLAEWPSIQEKRVTIDSGYPLVVQDLFEHVLCPHTILEWLWIG